MKPMEALNSAALAFLDASLKLYPQLDSLANELHEIENTVGDSGFRREVAVPLPNGKKVAYAKNGSGWGIRVIDDGGGALNWQESNTEDKAAIGLALNAFVSALARELSEASAEREHAATVIASIFEVRT